MGYRRVFIIRKDLHLSPGKLAAMVGHCAEAYWTRIIKRNIVNDPYNFKDCYAYTEIEIDKDIYEQYICGSFVKTICEARNRNHLIKAIAIAEELDLIEDVDFGIINDNCYTELTPENEDGTTTVGIWFKPLPNEIAHKISKKYPLYK